MTTTTTPPGGVLTARAEPRAPEPPLSPARRATLVLGTLLSVGVIGFTTVQIVGDLVETTERETFSVDPAASTLAIRTQLGDVRVTRSDDDRVHVVRTATFSLAEPEFAEGADGADAASGLLSATCPDEWPGACDVDYDVAVPDGMSVVLYSDHGDVLAADVTGGVDARSSTGDVMADRVAGPARLRSDHGSVAGVGLTGDDVDAASDTGDVRLMFAEAPTTVAAESDHGRVEVLLPSGTPYRVDAVSDVGDRTVTVDTSTTSSRTVTARSDTGDVDVLAAGPGRRNPRGDDSPLPPAVPEAPGLPEPPR